ncbi:hypothetical protein [Streptomyces sp. NPDC020377]|uniref:hypothetical protein n=1 Tax=Streptomyces sp. NPDC020377 TaxID=3365070 RepID=UPI0037B87017
MTQEQVEAGELKGEPARRIGRLPKEQQAGEAQKAISAANTPCQRRHNPAAEQDGTPAVNAVNTSETQAPKRTVHDDRRCLPQPSGDLALRSMDLHQFLDRLCLI